MTAERWRWLRRAIGAGTRRAWGVGAVALLAGCEERLTAPADCPALCPGGGAPVLDTVIEASPNLDSTFVGYFVRWQGASLRVSHQFPLSEDRAYIKFIPRPDSLPLRDTLRVYSIDSVALELSLQARDTLVPGLKVFLYRMPIGFDSTTPFGEIDQRMVTANLIDSIVVPDTLKSGRLRALLTGEELDRVAIPPADSGRLAIAVGITAAAPTGIRIASQTTSALPQFLTYARFDVADTSLQRRTISRSPEFNTFVSASVVPRDPSLLTVGGDSGARSIVRFQVPPAIRDSTTIVRATLELTPVAPFQGIPNDPPLLAARALLADLGAKSPLVDARLILLADSLPLGTPGPVRHDVTRIVRTWAQPGGLPSAVLLSLSPETGSFTQAVFASTRSPDPSARPRLRISYVRRFPFERP
ncbi:MAG TPA: hypothetical protein VNK43_04615 [Gemmatimonadales bacterium]|nr:hypothetical protein [Gemmatimonadales bacterium]